MGRTLLYWSRLNWLREGVYQVRSKPSSPVARREHLSVLKQVLDWPARLAAAYKAATSALVAVVCLQ